MIKGSCLCGDIHFKTRARPEGASGCHCSQCRKQSGHFWASAFVKKTALEISGDVTWYRSTENAERGFCPRCGAFLFWHADDEDTISFALGALDGPTGIRLQKHIFVADKGDYYEIPDALPRMEQS